MCGRFTLTWEAPELQQELGLGSMPADWRPRYNIAPSQPVAVVLDGGSRNVEMYRWGLVPRWAKTIEIGNRLINARSETLTEKPSFRDAFAKRRCLVLADGFYEWHHSTDRTIPGRPYYFQLARHKPFAFAGLWEEWKSPDGTPLKTCTIITCAANSKVAPVHERMPVILNTENMWHWLSPTAKNELTTFLVGFPPEDMEGREVSRIVNNVNIDTLECLQPV